MQIADLLRSGNLRLASRLSLCLVAVLSLVAVLAIPASAQQANLPPGAVAVLGAYTPATTTEPAIQALDGSSSFDPDSPPCVGCEYEWEVVTSHYAWLPITNSDAAEASFQIPSDAVIQRYGSVIEFRLTVTDSDGAEDISDLVVWRDSDVPIASVMIEAFLHDEDSNEDDLVDQYTIDAVIDGPGENGNDDNEWDIREGALLTLDGSASSDSDGMIATYAWVQYGPFVNDGSSSDVCGFPAAGSTKALTTDDDGTLDVVETLGNLTAAQSPCRAFYRLTVTDDDGKTDSKLVTLWVHDQPEPPEVELAVSAANDDSNFMAVGMDTDHYTVTPGSTLKITATTTRSNLNDPATAIADYEWSGGVAVVGMEDTVRSIEFDDDTAEGSRYQISVTVTDRAGLQTTERVVLVVTDNVAPIAQILNARILGAASYSGPGMKPDGSGGLMLLEDGDVFYETMDGMSGGDLDAKGRPSGSIALRGIGIDHDQTHSLGYQWDEIDMTTDEPVESDDAVLDLVGTASANVHFDVPEVETTTTVLVRLTVRDNYGIEAYSDVYIVIVAQDSSPMADAGEDQVVIPGSFVRLLGTGSSDPDKGDEISSYEWELLSIKTEPSTAAVLRSISEQVHTDLEEAGLLADLDNDGTLDINTGAIKTSGSGVVAYFTAPEVARGISSIVLTIQLTVTDSTDTDTDPSDGDDDTDTDTVIVTVGSEFYSGNIDSPDFCTNMSLGGPLTYPFDFDGDGVADICSLNTTRRATVAIQNALERMVALGETLAEGHNPPATFRDLVYGRSAVSGAGTNAISEIEGTCEKGSTYSFGDSAVALALDVCATGNVGDPPPPVDPTEADLFFSGTILDETYCTNRSLGGARTYAHDGDGDGVADVCSLPYTRREAVARQQAMELLRAHPRFSNYLRVACADLGSLDFGEDAGALEDDECSEPKGPLGEPLPTPTS